MLELYLIFILFASLIVLNGALKIDFSLKVCYYTSKKEGELMKKINYTLLFISFLFLFACTSTSIRKADVLTEKHNYLSALEVLEQKMYSKNKIDESVLKKYQQIFTKGEEYYNTFLQEQYVGNQSLVLQAKEKSYLLQKRYFSLPQSIKQQIHLSSFSLEEITRKREDLSTSYATFADGLSTETYQNRLQKYLAYEKALYYSSNTNVILQQKRAASSKNLEQNLEIRVQGNTGFPLQIMIRNQLQASLSSEKIFKFLSPTESNLFLRVQIQNYQYVEMPESFSTRTEYIHQEVAVNKVENGKIISKMETQKIPYQKIDYSQKQRLSYYVSYALYDKNQVLVFSGTMPINLENNRAWSQSIPLDIRYAFNLPKTEVKPNAMTKEQMQINSVAKLVKAIQQKIQTLKTI